MNLTELQVELRGIEDHISSLHSEIEKMKQQEEQINKEKKRWILKLFLKWQESIQLII